MFGSRRSDLSLAVLVVGNKKAADSAAFLLVAGNA